MKTRTTSILRKATLPTLVLATLLLSCSGDDTDQRVGSASATAITTEPVAKADNTNMDASTSAAAIDRYNATGELDPDGNYGSDGALRPGVVLAPAQERADALARMNGIRSTLMAELAEVRSHLNNGTLDKDHAAADKQRAADLAQGLERVDRTLAAMGNATDATWSDMRSAQLKEVDEVRTWWNAHMAERDAMAKQ